MREKEGNKKEGNKIQNKTGHAFLITLIILFFSYILNFFGRGNATEHIFYYQNSTATIVRN